MPLFIALGFLIYLFVAIFVYSIQRPSFPTAQERSQTLGYAIWWPLCLIWIVVSSTVLAVIWAIRTVFKATYDMLDKEING